MSSLEDRNNSPRVNGPGYQTTLIVRTVVGMYMSVPLLVFVEVGWWQAGLLALAMLHVACGFDEHRSAFGLIGGLSRANRTFTRLGK
jgi:hypothetical protein